MVFSSSLFLFAFLPAALALYFISPAKAKNYVLLAASLIFYAWGEPSFVFIMISVVLVDYISALLIEKAEGKKRVRQAVLILTIFINFFFLGYFKYAGLFVDTFTSVFSIENSFQAPVLPIGISFFTFQAISYVFDVYMKDVRAQKNPFNVLLYVSLFPQLIAGPIVRYKTVERQIISRTHSFEKISDGLVRFIIGFVKKVVFANKMALLADTLLDGSELPCLIAWLGSAAYMLQIYYDFSAYSDMAIGLGKIFGFDFEENFNFPYKSISVTEFWRRWHISLSTWFRDYVYIPLGGNKKGKYRQIFNMLVVWAFTGLWHGASWNYLLWGIYYFILLILEKHVFKNILEKIPKPLKWLLTSGFVLVGWVLFRSENLSDFAAIIGSMFSFSITSADFNMLSLYATSYAVYFIPAAILAFPIFPVVQKKLCSGEGKTGVLRQVVFYAGLLAVFFIAVCFLVQSTYNPFIYFRF